MNYEIYSYLCGKLQTRIAIISMATTIRETESGIRTSGMDTAEALWTIIAAQPRKVRKELAIRLQNDLSRRNLFSAIAFTGQRYNKKLRMRAE